MKLTLWLSRWGLAAISGLGSFLKSKNPNIGSWRGPDREHLRLLPDGANHAWARLSCRGFRRGLHSLDDGLLRGRRCDPASDKDCFQWTRRLVREEIYAGGSSGGAVCAAVRYAEKTGFKGNIVVIICDSAVTISKIFSDTWMKEGGYLEPEIGEETVGYAPQSLYTADRASPGAVFSEVIDQMKTHGISQPVIDADHRMQGLISENDLLKSLVANKADVNSTIDAYLDNNFALVEVTNRASLVSQLFAQGKVVVVEDAGRVIGILTNIDFIDWISSRLTA